MMTVWLFQHRSCIANIMDKLHGLHHIDASLLYFVCAFLTFSSDWTHHILTRCSFQSLRFPSSLVFMTSTWSMITVALGFYAPHVIYLSSEQSTVSFDNRLGATFFLYCIHVCQYFGQEHGSIILWWESYFLPHYFILSNLIFYHSSLLLMIRSIHQGTSTYLTILSECS